MALASCHPVQIEWYSFWWGGGPVKDVHIHASSIERHHLAWQNLFFLELRLFSRVHLSPRWPSAILGRVIVGPGGRKPASPLPWGSRRFTSVSKVIMALRYGIKSYESISVGQQCSGLGGNKSRWGERRTLQGMCGINYAIMMRLHCREQAKAACYLNWHQRWMKSAAAQLLPLLRGISTFTLLRITPMPALKTAYLQLMVL